MDHVDDPLLQQPSQPPESPEPPALPAPAVADVAKPVGVLPPLPPGWQAPWDSFSTGKLRHSGPHSLSGVTLSEVLLSPLQEIRGLLGNSLNAPMQPTVGQTMVDWVQHGLPAFPFPEDIRGSFMDHVI